MAQRANQGAAGAVQQYLKKNISDTEERQFKKKSDLKICMNFEMISQTADNRKVLLTVLLK